MFVLRMRTGYHTKIKDYYILNEVGVKRFLEDYCVCRRNTTV